MPAQRPSRRKPALIALCVALVALGWISRVACRGAAEVSTPPAGGQSPEAAQPLVIDPPDLLQPPSFKLTVKGCGELGSPVELYARVGAGGWDGGTTTTFVDSCNPDEQHRCTFSGLTTGRWIVRQETAWMSLWLEGDPAVSPREVALPCGAACAVDLVVEAEAACGETGTLRILPPVPLPSGLTVEGPEFTWSAGVSQRLEAFPCDATIVDLKSSTCSQVHRLRSPDGAPHRALRLHLAPVDRVTIRFEDHATGQPIPGVTMEDADYWNVLTSDQYGTMEVVRQSESKFMTALLEAHHPDYQSTSVFPPAMKGDLGVVRMQRRQYVRVECVADGAPCPGYTRVLPSFSSGPKPDPGTYIPGGGAVNGECAWLSPGAWQCETGRDFILTVVLDQRLSRFSASDETKTLEVDMSAQGSRGCIRGEWPSGDCVLELGETVHPVRQMTEFVPLPEGDGPVRGRVVCQEAVTWAEIELDRGGACTTPGPWSELAGICARKKPGPAVEDVVGALPPKPAWPRRPRRWR
jgi:hypothetical protein